jgi:gamma-glutamyltranspeptidase
VRGLVVSPNPDASRAGADVLAEGGSAVDAAVAASAALCVVHPHQASVGGHLSGLVWAPGDEHPVGVGAPGAPQAWGWLVERFGRLGLAPLMAPAAALARDGWVVTPAVATALAAGAGILSREDATWRLWPPLQAGMTLRNPDLAATLDELGHRGFSIFLHGAVGRAIGRALERRGGAGGAPDPAASRSTAPTPSVTEAGDARIHRLRENGADGVVEAAGVCAVDAGGLLVALVQGFRSPFGSGVVAEGTGILLSDGAPPLAALPALIERGGRPWGAVAASNPDAQRQVLDGLIQGLGAGRAVSAPRLRPQPERGALWVEADHPEARSILRSRADAMPVPPGDPRLGQAQAVARGESGEWEGGADPRTGGAVAGDV